jgi:hypothetical protein
MQAVPAQLSWKEFLKRNPIIRISHRRNFVIEVNVPERTEKTQEIKSACFIV